MPPPGPPDFDFGAELKRRIQPHLEEVGVEAFVMMGYVRKPDGKTTRIVLFNDGQDAACRDGLRQALLFGLHWGDKMVPPAAPKPSDEQNTPG